MSYFDEEFTNEIPMETPITNTKYLKELEGKQNLFNGFSFASNEGEEFMKKKIPRQHQHRRHHKHKKSALH